tara:strand:+ start:882 stop:1403 length:522 start_codon:yes stop_codon:yes gene_type:complete
MPIFNIGNKRILFIHIPKTGGTSIERILNDFQDKPCILDFFKPNKNILYGKHESFHMQHLTAKQIFNNFNFKVEDFDLIFTIIRDPHQRLISEMNWRGCYLEKKIRIINIINAFLGLEKGGLEESGHNTFQYEFVKGYEDKIKIFKNHNKLYNYLSKFLNINIIDKKKMFQIK